MQPGGTGVLGSCTMQSWLAPSCAASVCPHPGLLTSLFTFVYSCTRSTATMFVSSSEDIRTSQFSVWVTCMAAPDDTELSRIQEQPPPTNSRELTNTAWARASLAAPNFPLNSHSPLSPALQKLCCGVSDPQRMCSYPRQRAYPSHWDVCPPGFKTVPRDCPPQQGDPS